jgi:site-specific DNA-methyltransferase (adenine-specific)
VKRIVLADNMEVLPTIPSGSAALIYIDPPFNTGKEQRRVRLRTVRDEKSGDRKGFQGKKYRSVRVGSLAFDDRFDDFLDFLEPRLVEAKRVLSPTGSFFLHIDFREVH